MATGWESQSRRPPPPTEPYGWWGYGWHVPEPRWPDDYWPPQDAMADEAAWERTIAAFREDLAAVQALVTDTGNDLAAPLPYDRGYSLLREVLLVADHNAYHVGEFAILRQVLGAWPADH